MRLFVLILLSLVRVVPENKRNEEERRGSRVGRKTRGRGRQREDEKRSR